MSNFILCFQVTGKADKLLGLPLRGKTRTWRKDYTAHAFNKAIKDT